jgi:hypothetical protein
MRFIISLILLLAINSYATLLQANEQNSDSDFSFDDQPLSEELSLPDWFSLSFQYIIDSLSEALKEGKKVIIPAHADEGEVYNLVAKETKVLSYSVPELQSKDKVIAGLYVQLGKKDCAKVVDLNGTDLTQSQLMKEVHVILK